MFLGIEIGGTKLQLGIGPGDGTFASFRRLPVNVAAGAEGIRRQILETLPTLLEDAGLGKCHLKGVAFGFGGPVDDATERILKSHQVAGWDDFPLVEWAMQNLGLPTVLGNDADVAGLAEAILGAGKGLSPIFYMNIGSGIGGSLIINGEIYRGCGKGAVEVGHLWVDHDFWDRGRQTWSSLEKAASGWALAEQYRSLTQMQLTAQEIAQSAAGDKAARNVLFAAIQRIALALSHVIALFCPRRIVLGGGVSLMGEELLFKPLRVELGKIVFPPFADCYDIVPAALGEEVVVHGALAMARKRFQG